MIIRIVKMTFMQDKTDEFIRWAQTKIMFSERPDAWSLDKLM